MKQVFPLTKRRGFTLIEILVVVAVIGIIAAIAIPNYSQYVMRSRRAQAASCMQEYSQYLERIYSTNLTYLPASNTPQLAGLGCATENNLNTYYAITATALAVKSYTIQAVPQGTQATADTTCGTLQLDSTGQRSTPSYPANVTKCF